MRQNLEAEQWQCPWRFTDHSTRLFSQNESCSNHEEESGAVGSEMVNTWKQQLAPWHFLRILMFASCGKMNARFTAPRKGISHCGTKAGRGIFLLSQKRELLQEDDNVSKDWREELPARIHLIWFQWANNCNNSPPMRFQRETSPWARIACLVKQESFYFLTKRSL